MDILYTVIQYVVEQIRLKLFLLVIEQVYEFYASS